ncbi:hypothetical protein IAT38_000834 [Cryptococcus sp. DSM 104549]
MGEGGRGKGEHAVWRADTPLNLEHTFATLPPSPPLPEPFLQGGPQATFSSPLTADHLAYRPAPDSYPDFSGSASAGDISGDLLESSYLNEFSSPPSPSSSTIASTSDSQGGGDAFPPASDNIDEDITVTGPSLRPQNLSLNLQALSYPFPPQSPASLAISGAPYTDTLSIQPGYAKFAQPQDYFDPHADGSFTDRSLSSSGEGSLAAQIPEFHHANGPRLPASQPSSPARGAYNLHFQPQARQRGATFSGGSYATGLAEQQQQFTFQADVPQRPSPSPFNSAHFAFTQIQHPVPQGFSHPHGHGLAHGHHSPITHLAPSPAITASPQQLQNDTNPFFGAPAQQPEQQQLELSQEQAQQQQQQQQAQAQGQHLGLGMGEVLMEDVSTPTPVQPRMPAVSRRSSLSQSHLPVSQPPPPPPPTIPQQQQQPPQPQPQQIVPVTPDLTSDASRMEQLTLLEKIMKSAQSAKEDVLNGRPVELADLNHHVEAANEKVGTPAPSSSQTHPTPSSIQSTSPQNGYQTSPTVQTSAAGAGQYQQPQGQGMMPTSGQLAAIPPMTVQPSALLPSLPVEQSPLGAKRSVTALPAGSTSTLIGTGAPLQALSTDYLTGKLQAPPLVHSHSFPNVHQLPSQMSGAVQPSTPNVPSPSFIAQIGVLGGAGGGAGAGAGVQHMPMISSPLAAMPPSRPQSPTRYVLPGSGSASGSGSGSGWESVGGEMLPMEMSVHSQGSNGGMGGGMGGGVGMSMSMSMSMSGGVHPGTGMMERRPSTIERADGRPIVRGRSTSVNKPWAGHPGMTSTSVPPSAWQSRATSRAGSPDDGGEEDDSDEEGPKRSKRRRSSVGGDGGGAGMGAGAENLAGGAISEDVRRQLDQIFEEFLNRICSDLEVVDSKGEKIHQVLMPKKMAKLDESTDYRPFKFRIQAFTNAFTDNLQQRGITEETMSVKKIKNYLWRQDLISRFNPDGKKAKSKGNHIWNVDAKKLPGGGWVFRPFKRRIIGQPNSYGVVNQPYEWEPRIWDPQAPSDTLHPRFSSPPGSLPAWLRWEDSTKLVGVPDAPCALIHIPVLAEFIDGSGNPATIEASYPIQVVPHLQPVQPDANNTMYTGYTHMAVPQATFEYDQQLASMGLPPVPQPGMGYPSNMVYPQPGAYTHQ